MKCLPIPAGGSAHPSPRRRWRTTTGAAARAETDLTPRRGGRRRHPGRLPRKCLPATPRGGARGRGDGRGARAPLRARRQAPQRPQAARARRPLRAPRGAGGAQAHCLTNAAVLAEEDRALLPPRRQRGRAWRQRRRRMGMATSTASPQPGESSGVEVGERLSVDALLEDRKVRAERVRVELGLSCDCRLDRLRGLSQRIPPSGAG